MAYALAHEDAAYSTAGGIADISAGAFTPSAGSALIAVVGYTRFAALSVAMDDSTNGNDSWTEIATGLYGAGSRGLRAFYLLNAAASSTTVRATFSGAPVTADQAGIYVSEWTGIATSSALVGSNMQAQTNPGLGANDISSGLSGVLSSQPALMFGFCFEDNRTANVAAGTSPEAFTGLTPVWAPFGTAAGYPEHARMTATTSRAATFGDTTNGNANNYLSVVIALAEAGGGGGPSAVIRGKRRMVGVWAR